MQHWLTHDGRIWSEDILRQNTWTDEHLRAPHACRCRKKIVYKITDRNGLPVNATLTQPVNAEPTHIYIGSLKGRHGSHVRINASCEMRLATFEDGLTLYVLGCEVEPIPEDNKAFKCTIDDLYGYNVVEKRATLLDDIDALCLSIQKRQSELTRLVKQLKG